MAIQKLDASDVTLEVNGKPFGCSTSAGLSVETDMDEASCQASGAWKEYIPGTHGWTVDSDALARIATGTDATNELTFKDLLQLQIAKTLIPVSFGTNISGDVRFEGNAYISSFSQNRPENGKVTFSVSLQGTGPLAIVANA
ncbi:phage tail tube protein [Hymenobacter mucosus]|uniref:Phage tail tube protein n=1 Tax=Hymenobacter mucosus TaxID=1411120 RepID=A0A239AA21_9BACT|nr:phage tail tube protein [Hymenobacter mucosus]SNR92430.1 Phage tail tube protein [Hymenobacter mucosus]